MIAEDQKITSITLCAQDIFGETWEYELRADTGVFVGKSSNCGLQLHGQGLSDIHCRIGLDKGRLWVQDWMSTEGTFLNGKPIDSQTTIRLGDVIHVGKTRITVAIHHTSSKSVDASPISSSDARVSAVPPDEGTAPHSGETHESDVGDQAVEAIDKPSDDDFAFTFTFAEEEETYDRETVALLRAEIEELQTALAQHDAEANFKQRDHDPQVTSAAIVADQADGVLARMQELIDEANRSDERVAILEELLHVAEDTNRAEQDERLQLEAWVGDIEKRVGQREDEHNAEVDSLRQRLDEECTTMNRLQQQLQEAAFSGSVPTQYEQTLKNLQEGNRQLQEQLADSQKRQLANEKRLEDLTGDQERALREERASIAQEQAKLARMRFELSKKLAGIDELPKSANTGANETSHRIAALREHLREIHEQEKKDEKEVSLATRLSKLWKRMERSPNG